MGTKTDAIATTRGGERDKEGAEEGGGGLMCLLARRTRRGTARVKTCHFGPIRVTSYALRHFGQRADRSPLAAALTAPPACL